MGAVELLGRRQSGWVQLVGALLLLSSCSKHGESAEVGTFLQRLGDPLGVSQLLVEFDSLPSRMGMERSLKPDEEIVELLTTFHTLRGLLEDARSEKQEWDWAHPGALASKVAGNTQYSEFRERFIARAHAEAPLWGWDSKDRGLEDFPFEKFDSCWRLFATDDPVWFGMSRLLGDIMLYGSPSTAGFAGYLAKHLLAIDAIPSSNLMPLLVMDQRWPISVIARCSWESLIIHYGTRITDPDQLLSARESFTRIVVLCNLPIHSSSVEPTIWEAVREASTLKREGDSDFALLSHYVLKEFQSVHEALVLRMKDSGIRTEGNAGEKRDNK